ncbi:MAG: ABC transporter ATP-binding protein [Solirubrobacteraceae bacterium]
MPTAAAAIELIDVHTALGGDWVLKGVSFAAARGRITVMLGPSGVGKTTCLRHVVGLTAPDAGDILVEGRSTLQMRKAQRLGLSRRFGVLLQGDGLYGSALWDSMTVEENLLHQLRSQRDLAEDALRQRCEQRLREVGLAGSAKMMPLELSAGMRRRVALARALVADPDFAVLDSFELGVDPVRLAGLCSLLTRRHAQAGGTYVIATQSMEVARRLADDVVVMWDGRVIEAGPAEAVLGSHRPEVEQLVSGAISGPLGLAGEGRSPGQRAPRHPAPAEQGYEIPLWLAALGVLVALTASALVLGHGQPLALAISLVGWAALAALLVLRVRARRDRR